MRMNTAAASFEQEGFSEVASANGLSRKQSRKVTMLLTSGLYKRPKDATLRELVSNGIDSAPDASVEVMLPSSFNHALVVRDTGPGMSHAFMTQRYTTLADSTKDEDDDSIGGFGIGRLSPFADAKEQFVVTIFRGDHKQIYVIALIDWEITVSAGEPIPIDTGQTGTEVKIPCPPSEMYAWQSAAERALPYFPADRLTIRGATVERPSYTFECDDYAIIKSNSGGNKPTYALLGPVAYQLDASAISIPDFPSENVEFRFRLGELTPTPDREGVKLDARTIAALRAKHKKLMDHVKGQVEVAVSQATTLFSAQATFFETGESLGVMRKFMPNECMWQGEKIEGYYFSVNSHYTQARKTASDDKTFKRFPTRDSYNYYNRNTFTPLFLVDDVDGKKIHIRARTLMDQETYTDCFIISKAQQTALGPPDDRTHLASTIIPPVMQATGSVTSGKLRAYKWQNGGGWRESSRWHQTEVDVATQGYYLEFKGAAEPDEFGKIRNSPWLRGKEVYGLPGEFRKRADLTGWTEAIAYIRQRATRTVQDPEINKTLSWRQAKRLLDHPRLLTFNAPDLLVQKIQQLVRDFEPLTVVEDDYRAIEALLENGFITNPNPLPVPDLVGAEQELLEERPVFAALIRRGEDDINILTRSLEIEK